MESIHESGRIYFFKTEQSDDLSKAFSPLLEVNSNFDILKSLHLCGNKALGITSNNELLEWEFDSKKNAKLNNKIPNPSSSTNSTKQKASKKNDFNFLLYKPSYRFHKIKFTTLSLNKSMCIGLDLSGNVYVWGKNQDGLLGLGYDITSVDSPTLISKLKEIKEISLSDYHAVVINNNGNAFSWGLGKYGELGLERSIYSPTPQQILTETIYNKVYCGNLITCLLDNNGHFFYFGVIIKQLGGYNNTITLKSLLNDQSYQDGKSIYFEKEIEEIENENFINIVIGNGFVALLSKNGLLYVLEYNNKLIMLYNKYYLYDITVAYNEIYGLAREKPIIEKEKDNKDNYYLCRWNSKFASENDLDSDIWTTTMWKFKEDFQIISKCKLLSTNNNKNILLLKDEDEKYNLTTSIYNPHRKILDMSTNNNEISIDKSVNNPMIPTYGDILVNPTKKIMPEKFLEFFNKYDDSYNIKYKRCKVKINAKTGIDNNSTSYLNYNKSRTLTHFFKSSQNNNLVLNRLNNSLFQNVEPYNSNNYNNLLSGIYYIDNGKENDNVNLYRPEDDDLMDIKEKELSKYRNEVDNIINNFLSKKDSYNASVNSVNSSLFNKGSTKNINKKNENKKIIQNNSNPNERYSSNKKIEDFCNEDDKIKLKLEGQNRQKLKLSKENNNDNFISLKRKKFKNSILNKINSLFNSDEGEEGDKKYDHDFRKNRKKIGKSLSFVDLRRKNKKKEKLASIGEENDNSSSESFVEYKYLKEKNKQRNCSMDKILLNNDNNSNLEKDYISNSEEDNQNQNESKRKYVKKGKKLRDINKNFFDNYESNQEGEENEEQIYKMNLDCFKDRKKKKHRIRCYSFNNEKKTNTLMKNNQNYLKKRKTLNSLDNLYERKKLNKKKLKYTGIKYGNLFNKSETNSSEESENEFDSKNDKKKNKFKNNKNKNLYKDKGEGKNKLNEDNYNKVKTLNKSKDKNGIKRKKKNERNEESLISENNSEENIQSKDDKNEMILKLRKSNQINYKKNSQNYESYSEISDTNSKSNKNGKKERISKYKTNNMKENSKNENYYMNFDKGIKINKYSLMYFCHLINHYMKKKSFILCARQIANFQKYLEIKYSLKILFRLILKRIIFYKMKFMHRYKKINKYLIRYNIKSINLVYNKNNK